MRATWSEIDALPVALAMAERLGISDEGRAMLATHERLGPVMARHADSSVVRSFLRDPELMLHFPG